jgi:RNA polymerase subunit RPABC4/transcription elongation factor Spt4
MLVKCVCPTHGKNIPSQKIWSTIYIDISTKETPGQPQPAIIDEKKFCPNCGTILKEEREFCDACGTKFV